MMVFRASSIYPSQIQKLLGSLANAAKQGFKIVFSILTISLLLLSSFADAAQVNLLSSTSSTATGSGASGVASISSLNIPAGKNRTLFIWASFERDHCSATDNCSSSNTTGTGLGDNWPVMPYSTSPQITARVTGPAGSIDKKNALTIGGTPSGDLRFHTSSRAPTGTPANLAFYTLASYHIALRENEISQLLGNATSGTVSIVLTDVFNGINAGDDAIIIASVYENVDQSDSGIVRNSVQQVTISGGVSPPGNSSLVTTSYDAGQIADEATDGQIVMGMNAATEGFITPTGYTQFSATATTNNNGVFDTTSGGTIDTSEPSGMSAAGYFRNNPGSTGYTLQSAAPASTLLATAGTQSFLLESDNDDTSDAPTTYGIANHTITGIRLGASVDADAVILANATATGDDTNGTDDENGVTIPASVTASTAATIPISIQNASGILNAWVDWNQDGDFLDASEQVASERSVTTATTSISITPPATALNGTVFARFRVCTSVGLCNTPTGYAASGEVEDYTINVNGVSNRDYSDAPNTYGTPAHIVVNGVYLGTTAPDIESAPPTPLNGTGDDATGSDDEDGVTLPALTQGQTATVSVKVNGAGGYLQAWFDWNKNGTFDSGEQVATDLQDGGAKDLSTTAGTINFYLTVPDTATAGATYARFRWSTTAGLAANTGTASNGEVEDYAVTVAVISNATCSGYSTVLYDPNTTNTDTSYDGWTNPYDVNPIGSFPYQLHANSSLWLSIDEMAWSYGSKITDGVGDDAGYTGYTLTDADWDRSIAFTHIMAPSEAGNYKFTLRWGDDNVKIFRNGTQIAGLQNAYNYTPSEAPYVMLASQALAAGDKLTVVITEEHNYNTAIKLDVTPLFASPCTDKDLSDAPASYGTPSHAIVTGVHLGTNAPDGELTQATPLDGTGDDVTGTDDEDGITLPSLTQGSTATIVAKVNGNNGYLQGWIDWNGDGDFADSGEQIAKNFQDNVTGSGEMDTVAGQITFNAAVPSTAVTTKTYARFRWSSTASLDATSQNATDGEVEDYALTVLAGTPTGTATVPQVCGGAFTRDFGTGTAPTNTLPTGGSTSYNPYLPMDGGLDDWQYTIAPNPDLVDDFGGGYNNQWINGTDQSGSANGMMLIVNAAPATGTFYQESYNGLIPGVHYRFSTYVANIRRSSLGAGDLPNVTLSVKSGTTTLATVDSGAIPQTPDAGGLVWKRVDLEFVATTSTATFSIDNNQTAGGLGNDIALDAISVALDCDYGDAPDTAAGTGTGNYKTKLSDNGPSHIPYSSVRLGALIDGETDGLANSAATGDNLTGSADEDGVTIPTLSQGQIATISASVTGTNGYLQGWIDWNGNGSFEANEQIASNLQDNGVGDLDSSSNTISFAVSVPSYAKNSTYARFRWSTTNNLDSTTTATDGEVEDYAVTVNAASAAVASSCKVATQGTANGTSFTWAGTQSTVSVSTTNAWSATATAISFNDLQNYKRTLSGPLRWDKAGDMTLTLNFAPAVPAKEISLYINDIGYTLNEANDPRVTLGISGGATPSNFVMRPLTTGETELAYLAASGTILKQSPIGTSREHGVLVGYGTNLVSQLTLTSSGLKSTDFVAYVLGANLNCDFGDAPDTTGTGPAAGDYPTLGSSSGPQHLSPDTPTVYLGSTITYEQDGLPNATATGDSDDGVTIPVLKQGQTATITASVVGAGGYLQGWIDWDADGDFADTGEQVATNLQDNGTGDTNAASGTIAFSVTVPATATTNTTYARFRWSKISSLDTTTLASNGEVEDYSAQIEPSLTGTCDNKSYGLSRNNQGIYEITAIGTTANSVTHTLLNNTAFPFTSISLAKGLNNYLYAVNNGTISSVGQTTPVYSYNPSTPTVTAIDTGIRLPYPGKTGLWWISGATDPSGNIYFMLKDGSALAKIDANTYATSMVWTTWPTTGIKGPGGENFGQLTVNVPTNYTVYSDITFEANGNALVTDADGRYVWRIRNFSTSPVADYVGTISGMSSISDPQWINAAGTVRLYGSDANTPSGTFLINSSSMVATNVGNSTYSYYDFASCQFGALPTLDFGDAPATYGAPSHVVTAGIYLGSTSPDSEGAASTPLDGTGDDVTGADDEGSISFPSLTQGQTANLNVAVTGAGGYLQGWIDWNKDGDFLDAGEQIIANVQDNSTSDSNTATGQITLTITTPATALTGTTYARLRWSTTQNLDSSSAASNGEVEDYTLTINAATGGISGVVFEDMNYGGGAGRSQTTSSGLGVNGAKVELYNSAGALVATATTANDGSKDGAYSFSPLSVGNYYVRVVSDTVNSTRTGSTGAELAVQTFRTDGTTAVTNEVGGRSPSLVDGVANTGTETLNTTTFALSGGGKTQSITPITVSSSGVTGVDFGFNFDTIVNTNDSGQGSLRQFILNSNLLKNTGLAQSGLTAGTETSIFQLTGTAPFTISPTSTLPAITDSYTAVDASTQTGTACAVSGRSLVVQLDGTSAGSNMQGLTVSADHVLIRGLSIGNYTESGIYATSTGTDLTVKCNNLGLKADGSTLAKNTFYGIYDNGGANLTLGGTATSDRNIISGNGKDGARLYDVNTALIQNNYIGTTADGLTALSNNQETADYAGIMLTGAALATGSKTITITDNVISGNTKGVAGTANTTKGIKALNASTLTITNNRIGTTPDGMTALGNSGYGIYTQNATDIVIGGTTAAARNIISSNQQDGINTRFGTNRINIYGNYIGLGSDGVKALGNANNGIFLADTLNAFIGNSAASGRNIIGSNSYSGIRNSTSTATKIADNYLGTDVSGTLDRGNTLHGVYVQNSNDVVVGGSASADANLIVYNKTIGVFTEWVSPAAATTNTLVENNYVGILKDGETIAGNTQSGVETKYNTGVVVRNNTISGNKTRGVHVFSSPNTTIVNNRIGTNSAGTSDKGNTQYGIDVNIAAVNLTINGNVISGNDMAGIRLINGDATGSAIYDNRIGTNSAGTAAVANTLDGIIVDSTPNANIGSTTNTSNTISGNSRNGVLISGAAAQNVQVLANLIGLNSAGTSGIPNTSQGVLVQTSASNISIGNGTSAGSNKIAYNGDNGVALSGTAPSNVKISQNSIYANTVLGIDLGLDKVTLDDANDSDTGANALINFPIIKDAKVAGTNLVVSGCAPAGSKVEFFEADVSPTSSSGQAAGVNKTTRTQDYGEGESFVASFTEGTGEDTVLFSCSSLTDADGNSAVGMAEFQWTLALPSSIVLADKITATATTTGVGTSEFSAVALLSNQLKDYSDAPATYGTPNHVIVSGFKLGATDPDSETAQTTPLDGTGDDATGTDDEDGVVIPQMWAGAQTQLSVTVAGAGGYLQAWFDWNGDGDFADVGEQVATDLQDASTSDLNTAAGSIDFVVTPPLNAVLTKTYARFRWSTTPSLDATAAATDGEVEDYALTLATLPTQACTSEAWYAAAINPGDPALINVITFSGGVATITTQSTPAGTPTTPLHINDFAYRSQDGYFYGLNNKNTAAPPIVVRVGGNGARASLGSVTGLPTNVNYPSAVFGSDGYLYTNDANGKFYKIDVTTTPPSIVSQTTVSTVVNGPQDLVLSSDNKWAYGFYANGSTNAQFARLDTTQATGAWQLIGTPLPPEGTKTALGAMYQDNTGAMYAVHNGTGNVYRVILSGEDTATPYVSFTKVASPPSVYAMNNNDGAFCNSQAFPITLATDYSDAPATYGSAGHNLATGVYLGTALADSESAAQASSAADGDDTNGSDDEDGVTLPTFTKGQTATITTAVSGTNGQLQAWIDWNSDGDFADAGEQVATNLKDNATGDTNVAAGTISFDVTVPSSAANTTFARFRWSTVKDLTSTGVALDGEVEDYPLTIGAGSADLSLTKTLSSQLVAVGSNASFTLTVSNAGPATAAAVEVTDLLPSGLSYVSATTSNGSYDSATGKWTLSTPLASGSNTTLTLVAKVNANGVYRNRAWISASSVADSDSSTATGFEADDLGDGIADDDEAEAVVAPYTASVPACVATKAFAGWDTGSPAPANGILVTTSTAQNGETLTISNSPPTSGSFAATSPNYVFYDGASTQMNTARGGGAGGKTTYTFSAPRSGMDMALGDLGTGESQSVIGYLGSTPVYPVWRTLNNGAVILGANAEIMADSDGGSQAVAEFTFTSPVDRIEVTGIDTGDYVITAIRGCKMADLSLTKTASVTSASANDSVSFTLTVNNTWKYADTNVKVIDVLPTGYTYVSSTPSQGTYDSATGIWNVGTVAGNSSATLTLATTMKAAGSTQNNAAITAATLPDPDSSVSVGAGTDDLGDNIADDDEASATVTRTQLDYSDGPVSYGTPTHIIVSGVQLGSTAPDSETAAQPNATADGDDTNGTDDEDGITLPSSFVPGELMAVTATVAGANGRLQAWIDWNQDGDFAGKGEQVAKNLADNAPIDTDGTTGVITFNVTVPATAVAGNSYARFRWSTDTNLTATAAANDGEVEDYATTVEGKAGVSVSGRVFHDLNVNGIDETEAGLKDVVIVLHNVTNNSCTSTRTAANGSYQFDEVLAGTYTVFEAVGAKVPTPSTCPHAANDPNGFKSSTPNNRMNVTVATSPVTGLDFGDVKAPTFTLDNSKAILPNSTVTYPHVFHTFVDGSVLFAIDAEEADPANLNWATTLFLDANCDAKLGQGDTALNSALAVNAGDKVCILAKVATPADAPAGALHMLTLSSDFQYGDGKLVPNAIITHTDRTQTSAGSNPQEPTTPTSGEGKLSLEKSVWNVTRNIDGSVALPGETLRYTIRYENIGNGLLNELAVQDTVPEFTQLVPNSTVCGNRPPELTTCSPQINGTALEWVFTGQLKAGSAGHVSYEVTVE